MDMSTEKELFDKISEIKDSISEIKTDVAVLKNRDQPAFPCRAYMGIIEKEAELKREEIKKDINNLGVKVEDKVGSSWFKWVMGGCYILAAGSYVFLWFIYDKLSGVSK